MRRKNRQEKAAPGRIVSGRGRGIDDVLNDFEMRRAVLVAFRLSSTFDGAPSRCPRRDCRRLGRCHARPGGDGEPECGAGVGQHVVDQAADMLAFLCFLPKPEWRS